LRIVTFNLAVNEHDEAGANKAGVRLITSSSKVAFASLPWLAAPLFMTEL